MSTAEIVSINIGTAQSLGRRHGKEVISAIRKTSVETNFINVWPLGFEGDGQADPNNHGGPLQAVYMYPREHYLYWAETLDKALLPGAFGENVTVDGITEQDVYIGDTLTWGDAVFKVTKPRRPCYKLEMLHPGSARRMIQTGFCGWYLQVVRSGTVPTKGRIHVFPSLDSSLSVLQTFRNKKLEQQPIPDID